MATTATVQIAMQDSMQVEGFLSVPQGARSVVLFAHGSGSSRHSPRNAYVARVLNAQAIGTLLVDLLTPTEDLDYATRFDIALLTQRLVDATHWLQAQPTTSTLPLGYFGASTGAGAALAAAARLGDAVRAVVSRGGRPDLAGMHALSWVQCPTLLLVGELDTEVVLLNHAALSHLRCTKKLTLVAGATHLFEEAGTLEEAAAHAARWFEEYLRP
jgi:putative phosphoribosyl transferase